MPPEMTLVLLHDSLEPAELVRAETEIPRKPDRLQPKFGRQVVAVNMDMRWLVRLVASGKGYGLAAAPSPKNRA